MGGNNGQDMSFCVELQLIDTHLTVETMHGMRIVVPMINQVVVSVLLQYAVVPRTMNGAVGIGLQYASLILERPHRTSL